MSYDVLVGDAKERILDIPDNSVHCVVTSPPYYGLRDYGMDGQIGLEPTPAAFTNRLVDVFREVRRVLRSDGTCWVNMGDTYASAWPCQRRNQVGSGSLVNGKRANRAPRLHGLKEKDLMGMPWRLAFALQDDGWYLRQDIIWSKPNPMPDGAKDRCTKSHEYLFLLTKNHKYAYNEAAIRETSRTKRSVWEIPTEAFPEAHFATYPRKLVEPCIRAGCPEGGIVLDPFSGSGTTGVVAIENRCNYIGIELNPEYAAMSERRLARACAQEVLF